MNGVFKVGFALAVDCVHRRKGRAAPRSDLLTVATFKAGLAPGDVLYVQERAPLRGVAKRKNATPAQIALAWLLAQKPWIVPIPGPRKRAHLEENLAAADVDFSPDELGEIDRARSTIPVQGVRLPEDILRMTGR